MINDAIVIGGGFYGASIANYLARTRGFTRVILLEREAGLLSRASFTNQARVHNGYHYPRSFTTAFRSRINLPKFVHDYPEVIKRDFTKLYAIARRNSKINSNQFERFCHSIGAKFEIAPQSLCKLFEPRLIEQVFITEEFVFDAKLLAVRATLDLERSGVKVLLNTVAEGIFRDANAFTVHCTDNASPFQLQAHFIFNCTYSGLNQLKGEFAPTRLSLKHEITEMLLIQPPPPLKNLGITVMDGPFFSVMPFPSMGLHTLSHVRYTPHYSWTDDPATNPYERMLSHPRLSHANWMIRDASRYLPSIGNATVGDSLFEVKTVLIKNEGDDGRPILFDKPSNLPGFYSILGSKIDNIYDVLERLDNEPLNIN